MSDDKRPPYELHNPPWVGAVAIIGGILVSCAIVVIFAVMWR